MPTRSKTNPHIKEYKHDADRRWHCHGWSGGGDEMSYHYEDMVSEKEMPHKRPKRKEGLGLYSILISLNKFEAQYPNIPLGKKITNSQMLKVLKNSIAVSRGKRTETQLGSGAFDVAVNTTWADDGGPTKQTLDELTTKVESLVLQEVRRIKKNLKKKLNEREIDV